METHRKDPQGGRDVAISRVKECLDLLEMPEDFNEGVHWDIELVPGLTVEKVIRALVSAEQEL